MSEERGVFTSEGMLRKNDLRKEMSVRVSYGVGKHRRGTILRYELTPPEGVVIQMGHGPIILVPADEIKNWIRINFPLADYLKV